MARGRGVTELPNTILFVAWFSLTITLSATQILTGQVLNPPYFNLAEGRQIWASATCGENVFEPELYCKLVGANTDRLDNPNINLIQGQVCDFCDPNDPKSAHPPEYAIDGTERWWQSPPLSRGNKYNEVNLTINLAQEFHVAYVFIKMGNSPRPGVWVLERSVDNGENYRPWQYFADTPGDCIRYFGQETLQPVLRDDSVICETKFSKVVPLEGGEIVVSLLNDRPNADNFSYSSVLQEWTKATNVRLRFLRTKTLLGHLMSVARQDPTVTRRYFYSIKDINIGGRCVCNGHAETCDITDLTDPYKLLCRCQHNTCGAQCDECCPGFVQKQWRRAIAESPFECEPCNCFGHSDECIYDKDVDSRKESLDIHGHYEGGGICLNCRHHTTGINCNECEARYYRPYGKQLNDTEVCIECQCNLHYSTGNCADGNGQCECRPEFRSPYCDECSAGYYGYPNCRPCDCNVNGTREAVCEVGGGQCPCKPNYAGESCDHCAESFFGFPDCHSCDCEAVGSLGPICNLDSGQCECSNNYGGRECNKCDVGYYGYPGCEFCSCDPDGTTDEVCHNETGSCLCREGYGGVRCDQCLSGYYGYPQCIACGCDVQGSSSSVCDRTGRCRCLPNFSGPKCDQCSPGYYSYPECLSCDCEQFGSLGVSCNNDGNCVCHRNFDGEKCNRCREGFYNYPLCEECNCNPAGIVPTFGGCGSLTSGELCECKRHVTGRICHQCKTLYWNLKTSNPDGCEDCNCYEAGTLGGMGICDGTSGQCVCKPNVASRQCNECQDGTFQLEDNLFGCKDCGCDIGGSVNSACHKQTGQCSCRPRINGRKCDKALQTHYFPTLYQHQFEIEDGRTPANTQVRFGYDENIFPGFSWRGYAVFSDIQKEILMDIYVEKPSLYQALFRYLNFGGENVAGTITFTPEEFADIQQSSDMVFEATSRPRFMRVASKQSLTASPFVLNPGRWTVSVKIEKPLFLDYMVLLPQAYYEATLLQEDVKIPCKIGYENGSCRHYWYPSFSSESVVVRGEAGYIDDGDKRTHTQVFENQEVLEELQTGTMAWLNNDQTSLHTDIRVSKPGPYVVVIVYHTPEASGTASAIVELSTAEKMDKGRVILYDCNYSFLCREVLIQGDRQIAVFDLDSNFVSFKMTINNDSNVAIDSIALIPFDQWSSDYVMPQTHCIRKDGICIETTFPPVPEATKIEFESGQNKDRISEEIPATIYDKDAKLIYLDHLDAMVDVQGAVPEAGHYTIVVHYYQPDHPRFDMDVLIQNGQFYEVTLPIEHCSNSAGCRAVVQEKITNINSFQILQNFILTLKEPNHKSIWVDYVLAIPSSQYSESQLHPLPQDKAGKFITQCGQNNFYISYDKEGYCRDAAFSLTSEYNNGALPCRCNADGSLSYECEEFGGQCKCRPNVIGRTCSRCQTGYYGFPNCKLCDCPSTAICQEITGQCICPPRVTGEKCNACIPHTYGFDAIIGCEECDCNPLGVEYGNLQCDLNSGQCECKANVIGRTCDRCQAGYWAYPRCHLCSCDLRGTTEEICNQNNAKCHCKENVYGESCDQCRTGTFHLEETNPTGCTKCFCFGTTDRCSSAYLFYIQIADMDNWKGITVTIDNDLNEKEVDSAEVEREGSGISAELPLLLPGDLFYFSAPAAYLGRKIASYGGSLYYTLSTTVDREESIGSIVGPDVILMGNNITIAYDHIEQPDSGHPFEFKINIIEREFRHLSGREVSREQMMMVLVNLEAILIRGSYFQPAKDVRLNNVLMDTTSDHFVADAPQALRVEHCQCPPNYQGTSCEECAPGYYRSKTGPYLGFCVPCQCNGHSDRCDVNTGKCFDCKHNTVGDHCEMCISGYHGDATQKTPYDCLICACPLPVASNNFAESCEVSPSGLEISCNCKPGYYGPRCEVCAAGYYGRPEERGNFCRPCECSGNIDTEHPGSCDSVTGECVLCLNNTSGPACEICGSFFYGDAIILKDCRQCRCDKCGAEHCDHTYGDCNCWPNVIGDSCDQCAPDHWGFHGCRGCYPCNCGPASVSSQCNVTTGQCDCKVGATGITCDICEPGYWLYSENGCESCNCDEKYSAGAVCNPITGQCQCLPGVMGDKCDRCPHRWAFVNQIGCHECGPCVHALLDDTDALKFIFDPVWLEVNNVSESYFAYQRLSNVNATVDQLRPKVESLIFDPSEVDLKPLIRNVEDLDEKSNELNNQADHYIDSSKRTAADANHKREMALEVEQLVHKAAKKVQDTVKELKELAEGLIGSIGPDVNRLIVEAERILEELEQREFLKENNEATEEKDMAEELLARVKDFEILALISDEILNGLKERLEDMEKFYNNYVNYTNACNQMISEYWEKADEIQKIPTQGLVTAAEKLAEEIKATLKEAQEFLDNATKYQNDAEGNLKMLSLDSEKLEDGVDNLRINVEDTARDIEDLQPIVDEATLHANDLMKQAELLDRQFADTRKGALAAVRAATAYDNIVAAINAAKEAAEEANVAASQAANRSDGVTERAFESKDRSSDLLKQANELLDHVMLDLEPRLDNAKGEIQRIAQQNEKATREMDIMGKELEKLPFQDVEDAAKAAGDLSENSEQKADDVKERIKGILDGLDDKNDRANKVPEDLEDVREAVKAADSYVDRVSSIVPDMKGLMERVANKGELLKILGKDVSDKIAELRRKVALARNQANRIKVGVTFFENTTLQLRNPEGLNRAATYTQMSLYFKTARTDGLLVYVGNERGTHNHLKRVLTDDYMALEVRAGVLVLSVDLGSGHEKIVNQKYVSDGVWHKVIVERTGKTFTLIVKTEDEEDSVIESTVPGTFSVFNLDQQLSKLYVGGIPDRIDIQNEILSRTFVGCIEELEFGNIPVGLWNFVEAENNFEGCVEREQLVILQPSNGLRYDGSGYAILPRRRHNFAKETIVRMEFKTYASEGLLFLVGKDKDLFALEIKDGRLSLKFDLGGGIANLNSNEIVNDGKWHSAEATRIGKEAILKHNDKEVDSGKSSGIHSDLSTTDDIYVGGYPGDHSYIDVTNVDFEGCIKNVQIGSELKDLNNNKEALGVVNGCPATIARTVSFSNATAGYVAMPNINLERYAQLTFKFKTEEENGLLFYTANDDQSDFLSISLSNGMLVMRSEPGGEISTNPDIKYNDVEWHYVTATKEGRELRLDIDDIDVVKKEFFSGTNVVTTTPLYFGGVPENYELSEYATPITNNFIGCIGDTTVNGKFQNFADTQDRPGASLASCPLADVTTAPSYPTAEPTFGPDIISPEPTPLGRCILPMQPRTDYDIKADDGFRFGNTHWSRQEFAIRGSALQEESLFSMEFNTAFQDGVLLYISGENNKDFEGLYMHEGKLNYVFNCGSGAALISTPSVYNDSTWHEVVFSRKKRDGLLTVDDVVEVAGESPGTTNSMNVKSPLYIGGLSEEVSRMAKENLKGVTMSLPGCIRNVRGNNEILSKRTASFGVTGCSYKVEAGTFFSAEGGYVILYDNFNVGRDITISMKVKPRNPSGVLVAIHSSKDYLLLQLVDGDIKFTADNGHGPFSATYTPPEDNQLCNGQWHSIEAVKTANLVVLNVDTVTVGPEYGTSGVSATDTNDPFYLGGVPDPGSLKGVETTEQFVGCINYFAINNVIQSISEGRISGDITLNTCPII